MLPFLKSCYNYVRRALSGAPPPTPTATYWRPKGRAMIGDTKWDGKLPSPTEQHREWLKSSCLTDKDIPGQLQDAERTIEFFDVDGEPLMYDLMGISVQYAQRRLFTPSSGKEPENKYVTPTDQPLHIYYPRNKKGFDWRKWAQDPTQPKIFVEGAKKAACVVNFGLTAAALQSCWGFSDKKRGHPLLLDFDAYELDGCDVYWVPDRDRKEKAVNDVFQASETFAYLLKELGARVHIVELPFLEGFAKIGVDDFLFHYNQTINKKAAKEAFEKLLADAGEWAGYDLTDPGNARRWVELYGHRFRYVNKRWLEYKDGLWQEDETGTHELTVSDMFQEMINDAKRSGVTKWIAELQRHVTKIRVDFAVAMARRRPPVAAKVSQFDKQPLWLNSKERTVELPPATPPKKGKQQ